MDDNEHEELMNYLESLEALEEADKELQETLGYILDITNQEIIMDINIHRVTKIEIRKRHDMSSFSTRDIVIHSKEFDYDKNDYVSRKTSLNCFLSEKSASKLIYTKQNLSVSIASKLLN